MSKIWNPAPIVLCLLLFSLYIIVPTVSPDNNERLKGQHFDGFISYRRSTSKHLARLLKIMLANKNVSAFLDVEDLIGGVWDVQLMDSIANAPNFILVLSNGTLERCKLDFNYTSILHKEIKTAVDLNKRIVTVFDSFDWPESHYFSKEINFAVAHQGIEWVHHLADQSLQRIIKYMNLTGTNLSASGTELAKYPVDSPVETKSLSK